MCSLPAAPGRLAAPGAADPTRRISSTISALLLLRSSLRSLPAVGEALSGARAPLLAALAANLQHPAFGELLAQIDEVGSNCCVITG